MSMGEATIKSIFLFVKEIEIKRDTAYVKC